MPEGLKKKSADSQVSGNTLLKHTQKEEIITDPIILGERYIAQCVDEVEPFMANQTQSGVPEAMCNIYLDPKKVKSPFVEEELQDPFEVAKALREHYKAKAQDQDSDENEFLVLNVRLGGKMTKVRMINIPDRKGANRSITARVIERQKQTNVTAEKFIIPKRRVASVEGASEEGVSFNQDEIEDDE